jgi:hypothetical protein
MTPDIDRERGFNAGGVGAGLIVLALGVLMLLDRSGYGDYHLMRYFPGIALLALGLSSVTNTWCARGRRWSFGGLWLVLIGLWMIVSESEAFGLTYRTTWPLLIIGVGILIVAGALFPRPPVSVKKEEEDVR